jgi:hypothetical protein
VSVEDFDRNDLTDQPNIIYGYTDDYEDLYIEKLSRSGCGESSSSPDDIIDRETNKSTLDDSLPELPISGQDELQHDVCGEGISAFTCKGCGSPVYVGRIYANSL